MPSQPDPYWASAVCRPFSHLQSRWAVQKFGTSLLRPLWSSLTLSSSLLQGVRKRLTQDRLTVPGRRETGEEAVVM